MSDDKIAEIRARHLIDAKWCGWWTHDRWQRHDDLGTALDEVDRQRAEIERLTGALKQVSGALSDTLSRYHKVGDQLDRLDATNDLLQEENERLRAETEQLRDILRCVSVQPDRDRTVKISFFSEGDSVSWSIHPQTSWAREVLTEFEQDRRLALEENP